MATATKKSRAAKQLARPATRVPASQPMEFLVFEDNAGSYHWTIVGEGGRRLVRSDGFASYGEAADAACDVREGAGAARLAPRAADDHLVDLTTRRAAASRDDLEAEQWLDEGGSFTNAVVTQWPAEP